MLVHVCCSISFAKSIQLQLLPPTTFTSQPSYSFSKLLALHCLVHTDKLPSITLLTKQRWDIEQKKRFSQYHLYQSGNEICWLKQFLSAQVWGCLLDDLCHKENSTNYIISVSGTVMPEIFSWRYCLKNHAGFKTDFASDPFTSSSQVFSCN